MRAVLISTQPKWCELIASGKKTVEVRKSKPTLETPFKCYIYQTKTKRRGYLWEYDTAIVTSGGDVVDGSQKVIGEFVCDRIDAYKNNFFALRDKNGEQFNVGKLLSDTCLTLDKLSNYISGTVKFYGWHISNLKIYDKPKELSEFNQRKKFHWYDYCGKDKPVYEYVTITRPPQNWCYVEEI